MRSGGEAEADLLPPEEAERTRALIGALIYIGSTSRPDIAQATYKCATSMSRPTRLTWTSAVRVLTYLLRTRHLGITYGRGGDSAHLHEGMQKSGSEAARDYAGRREAREVAERIAGLQGWSDASWEAFAPSITGHIWQSPPPTYTPLTAYLLTLSRSPSPSAKITVLQVGNRMLELRLFRAIRSICSVSSLDRWEMCIQCI